MTVKNYFEKELNVQLRYSHVHFYFEKFYFLFFWMFQFWELPRYLPRYPETEIVFTEIVSIFTFFIGGF